MLSLKKKMLMAGGARLRPQDVFATSLYTGNGGTQTITNGLDLAGKGGLVWEKERNAVSNHWLVDTVRGASNVLRSDTAGAEQSNATFPSGFTNSGYLSGQHPSGNTVVGWSFRRAKKFFDTVTYTGNGVAGRQIPHALGDVPGMIVIKRRSAADDWIVRHRAASGEIFLNATNAQDPSFSFITASSATTFTINPGVNTNGTTFVAYLFAQNPDLIDCGNYTGNGSATGPTVTCGKGWIPQWLLVKRIDTSGFDWQIWDAARSPANSRGRTLSPNTSGAEVSNSYPFDFTATGFQPRLNDGTINQAGGTYVYLAIRAPT